MELGKEYFGPLWRFIANDEITDVDYNGREIWLTNIYNERYRVNQSYVEENLTTAFVEQFTQRIANVVSRQFNKRYPELEAETVNFVSRSYMSRWHGPAGASASGKHRRLFDSRRKRRWRNTIAAGISLRCSLTAFLLT